MRADLVLSNGRVFDGDSVHPTATAVAVADGAVVAALHAARFDLHLHAIADRAVRTGLDVIARAAAPRPGHPLSADGQPADSWQPRHNLAHVQLVHPRDVPRFGELGVTVDAQALPQPGPPASRDRRRALSARELPQTSPCCRWIPPGWTRPACTRSGRT